MQRFGGLAHASVASASPLDHVGAERPVTPMMDVQPPGESTADQRPCTLTLHSTNASLFFRLRDEQTHYKHSIKSIQHVYHSESKSAKRLRSKNIVPFSRIQSTT